MTKLLRSLLFIGLFVILLSPSCFALGVGQSAATNCTGTSCTTSAIATTTGSTFIIYGAWDSGTCSFSSVQDSPANSYTQINTELTLTSVGGNSGVRSYYVKAGTGSATHTFTLNTTVSCVMSVWAVELTGSSVTLDQANRVIDASSPFSSPSLTTTIASELLIGFVSEASLSGTCTHTHGNSFTQVVALTDCNSEWTGAISQRSVSSTGSYQTSVTITGTFGDTGDWLTTWYEPGSTGGAPQRSLMGVGL